MSDDDQFGDDVQAVDNQFILMKNAKSISRRSSNRPHLGYHATSLDVSIITLGHSLPPIVLLIRDVMAKLHFSCHFMSFSNCQHNLSVEERGKHC